MQATDIDDVLVKLGLIIERHRGRNNPLAFFPSVYRATTARVRAGIRAGTFADGARMNRLGGSLLYGLPLLEPEELMAKIDAVQREDLEAIAAELWAPERLSAAGIGPDEGAFKSAVEALK